MNGKFYVITINYKNGSRSEAIETALSSQDWLRFSSNVYYVYSAIPSAKSIYDLVKPIIGPADDIFVVELKAAHRHGWASKVAVDWLKKARL